jgi:DNA or RNA helicases of superfamily II
MQASGLTTATEKAEQSCIGKWDRIIVGSVQSLCRNSRLSLFSKTYFDTIIIDEAHHALSNSYQAILNYFDEADVLGVTATPDRADMKNLGQAFDSLAYEYTLREAISSGYLVPIQVQTLPLHIDFTNVKMTAGDFQAGDVGRVLDPYLEQIADTLLDYKNRKIVVFLPLIETSQKFCNMLIERGFNAAEVNGNSENRNEITEDFANGKYNVLCNSMLLTEGWDCPSVDCVIVLRPTKSRALYTQMIGRGTRLCEGKDHLLVLDFLWHYEKHSLCRPAHLIAKSDDVADKMTQILETSSMGLEEAEVQAEHDVLKEREAALAKELEAMRKKKAKLVDPLQFEFSIQAEDLTHYTPSFGWQATTITDKQKKTIEDFGLNPDAIEDAGKASLLIDRLHKRKAEGLSTPKQIRFLENKGFKNVGTWTNVQASNMISRISASGWRIPKGISPATYQPS